MLDLSSPIARVRSVGRMEAVSFLLLLGIAMPLKYLAGQPMAVTIVGWIHGALFIALAMVTFAAWANRQLSFGHACLVAIASLIPFGPFLIDRKLARREAEEN
jgi:integral membrane protein